MNSTVYIYTNNIACYGPWYTSKCKRLDEVRYEYECVTNGCLAHWSSSAFAQFDLFTTTIGRLTH